MKTIKQIVILSCCFYLLLISPNSSAQAPTNKVTPGTYKTIYEMLRDVPGLDVKITSDRSGGTVIIRGTGSLNNQKPPLFVVDGSIYSGDITNINPQDVDAISVLKDAASAAAYGAQGAAGVIIITTKKGEGVTTNAVVSNYSKSAYTYFIEHKTPLKVIGHDDKVIIEGIIQGQKNNSLVFIKKKKKILIPVRDIKKVEMINN